MGQGGLGVCNLSALSRLYWNKQVTDGGIKGEQYPNFQAELTEDAATMQWIKETGESIVVKSILCMAKAPSVQLLGVIPRDSVKLSDAAFEALIFSKLQYLPDKFKPPCENATGYGSVCSLGRNADATGQTGDHENTTR